MQTIRQVSVLNKIPCFFDIIVSEQESTKPGRSGQRQVLASSNIVQTAAHLIENGEVPIITGKIDGTCTYFYRDESDGKVKLMMRQDLRIATFGRHKGKYVSKKGRPSKVPDGWISFVDKPDVEKSDSKTKWAHHIGFRPANDIQDKWAFEAIEDGKVRVLTQLYPLQMYEMIPIDNLAGKSCEFIGPKVQSDPHQIGVHCFTIHGSFTLPFTLITRDDIETFLKTDEFGKKLEGIVWHFVNSNKSFKVHRGHFGMEWK